MARATGGTKALALLDRVRATPATAPPKPWDDPAVRQLEERFLELRRQMLRDAVETAVELGQILLQIRPRVRRYYGRWLERVGVHPTTAHNYERLAMLAAHAPQVLIRWKELGPTKLYRVAKLSNDGRRQVLARSRSQTLAEMNDREFATLTAQFVERHRRVTSAMRAHGFRMKLRAWREDAWAFHRRCGAIDDDRLCAALGRDIEDLVQALGQIGRKL